MTSEKQIFLFFFELMLEHFYYNIIFNNKELPLHYLLNIYNSMMKTSQLVNKKYGAKLIYKLYSIVLLIVKIINQRVQDAKKLDK
jgi:hypothetical protein